MKIIDYRLVRLTVQVNCSLSWRRSDVTQRTQTTKQTVYWVISLFDCWFVCWSPMFVYPSSSSSSVPLDRLNPVELGVTRYSTAGRAAAARLQPEHVASFPVGSITAARARPCAWVRRRETQTFVGKLKTWTDLNPLNHPIYWIHLDPLIYWIHLGRPDPHQTSDPPKQPDLRDPPGPIWSTGSTRSTGSTWTDLIHLICWIHLDRPEPP